MARECREVDITDESTSEPEGGAKMLLDRVGVTGTRMDGPGQQIGLSATVKNTGGEAGTAEVKLELGDYQVAADSKNIASGGSNTFGGSVSYEEAVNNLTGEGHVTQFTLQKGPNWESQYKRGANVVVLRDDNGGTGPNIRVSFLSEPETTPSPGDRVELAVIIGNTGDSEGTSDIPVYVNGNRVKTISEHVDRDESVELGLRIDIPDTNTVSVSVGDRSVEFPVDNGGEEPIEKDPDKKAIMAKVFEFATDNPYAVGAGAMGIAYLATGGDLPRGGDQK